MIEQNIFEIASRNKFRFQYRGSIAVEDLFDLNNRQLNEIYKSLNTTIQSGEPTLLDAATAEDRNTLIKIEIVKSIFNENVARELVVLKAKETLAKKQRIMEIIGKKQDATLEGTPIEELQKMLNEL